jgi:cytochrome c peroxidase
MPRVFILLCLLLQAASAARLTVRVEPRWGDRPLAMNELSLATDHQEGMSVSRLAMLLSRAELQRTDGSWIGARDWVALLDAGKGRLSFELPGIPAERFTALRFDLGLDEETDKSDPVRRAAGHPLHPDVCGLHWGWRGGYVFLAIEGRYSGLTGGDPEKASEDNEISETSRKSRQGEKGAEAPQGESGSSSNSLNFRPFRSFRCSPPVLPGYSYHLAGQACRGTIELPVELDLRGDLVLTLAFDARGVFGASHRIDIAAADSTHSKDDGGLAERLADNAVRGFSVLKLEPDLSKPAVAAKPNSKVPALLAEKVPAHFPEAAWPADNPLTEAGVELGRMLFHDAQLSVNGTQSCASCHLAEHASSDPRRFSLGAEGQVGTRNAMPLANLAWKPAFFWDGRSLTLRDQVLRPIEDPLEMHESLDRVVTKIGDLAPRFGAAFGTAEVTSDRMARALEQYLLTLISGTSKMDRTVTTGERLDDLEQRGFELFFTESDPGRGIKGADCFHCHGGAHFTNHQFLNNGLDGDTPLADEGLARITGKPADRAKFIVPSLRNVARTAPYMHDGRFATLEEVIEHYDHGVQSSATLDPNLAKHLSHGGLGLSDEDKRALIAFLKALSDEPPGVAPR